MFCYNNVLMFSPMGGKERTSVYLVGWENAWDWMPFWKDWGPTYQEGWCGFYNIPREAVLAEDNTLKVYSCKRITESPEELAGRSGHSDKRRREKRTSEWLCL